MSELPPRRVEVVDHDPAWAVAFDAARVDVVRAVPEALAIEHIGSTSVPGLKAKPVIDILLVVPTLDVALAHVGDLAAIGFEHRPSAFAPERRHLYFRRVHGRTHTHHLHVLEPTSSEVDDYRAFRALLIEDADVRRPYEELKVDLAVRYPEDIAAYVAAKEAVVERMMIEARRRWAQRQR